MDAQMQDSQKTPDGVDPVVLAPHWLVQKAYDDTVKRLLANDDLLRRWGSPITVPDEWERSDLDAFLVRLAEQNYPQPQYLKIRVGRLYALFADLLDYLDADQANLTYRGIPVELIDDCPDPLEGGLNMPLPL